MRIAKTIIPTNYEDSYWKDNFQDLRQTIVLELGWPVVKVELTDVHLNLAIHEAISKYLEYDDVGLNFEKLPVAVGGWATIPDYINVDLIRDVVFPQKKLSGVSTTAELSSVFLGVDETLSIGIPNHDIMSLDVKNYLMLRQQFEDVRKIIGIDRSWEILDKKIKIYPTGIHETVQEVGVIYGAYLLPADYETEEWIKSYAVSKAKILLGTIRRKFSGFAFAGGQGSTDGAELINEGKEEIAAAIENKKQDLRPPPIFQL